MVVDSLILSGMGRLTQYGPCVSGLLPTAHPTPFLPPKPCDCKPTRRSGMYVSSESYKR